MTFTEDADAATLHHFLWLKDKEIGEISTKSNWLVGEYDKPNDDIYLLHWTLGEPYFEEYSNTEFSSERKKKFVSITIVKSFNVVGVQDLAIQYALKIITLCY